MNRLNVQWTAKTLVNQMKRGNVNFDNAVQRGLVWDVEKKSLLIHSMVYGYAIPAMYFTRDENKVYDSLDGKQRSNAICEFMNDEFALVTDTPPVYDDDGNMEDISGMTFSQLPEWVQDRINEYSLTIYYYEDNNTDENTAAEINVNENGSKVVLNVETAGTYVLHISFSMMAYNEVVSLGDHQFLSSDRSSLTLELNLEAGDNDISLVYESAGWDSSITVYAYLTAKA